MKEYYKDNILAHMLLHLIIKKHAWLVGKSKNAQNFIYVLLAIKEYVYDDNDDKPNDPTKPECS